MHEAGPVTVDLLKLAEHLDLRATNRINTERGTGEHDHHGPVGGDGGDGGVGGDGVT